MNGMFAGKKGVLFSVIVLILLLGVLSIQASWSNAKKNFSSAPIERAVFGTTQGLFDDIENSAVAFRLEGDATDVQQRILPFTFSVDQNTIVFSQNMPIKEQDLVVFFDAMNSFRVWLKDANHDNFYFGQDVDANTSLNSSWGGTAQGTEFFILPQCLKYVVFNQYFSGFAQGAGCEGNFDETEVRRFDLNVLLEDTADFNRVYCSFDSNIECPQNAFDPLNADPFVEINIFDQNCTRCGFASGQKLVSGHFDPDADNNVVIACTGSPCNTPDFNITISPLLSAAYDGPRQRAQIGVTFNSEIDAFEFHDFNFSIENRPFRLKKTFR